MAASAVLHSLMLAWLWVGPAADWSTPSLSPMSSEAQRVALVGVTARLLEPAGHTPQPQGVDEVETPSDGNASGQERTDVASFASGTVPSLSIPDIGVEGLSEIRVAALVEVDAQGTARSVQVRATQGSPAVHTDVVRTALSDSRYEPSGGYSALCVHVRFDLVDNTIEVTPQTDLKMSRAQRCLRWAL